MKTNIPPKINPLVKIVSDENGEISARILSLFALEGLHSDFGDEAIKDLQNSTNNEILLTISRAMFVKGMTE